MSVPIYRSDAWSLLINGQVVQYLVRATFRTRLVIDGEARSFVILDLAVLGKNDPLLALLDDGAIHGKTINPMGKSIRGCIIATERRGLGMDTLPADEILRLTRLWSQGEQAPPVVTQPTRPAAVGVGGSARTSNIPSRKAQQ
jgi:hypothetical protein